jgi:pimeloyl-ACP methyl ester carboxylesterase
LKKFEPFEVNLDEIDEESEFEEIDSSYLETIKDLEDTILFPEFEAYWMLLFQELNLYRFVHHDEEIEDIYEIDEEELHRPILLIHGFHSSHLTWNWMVQQLWIDGFRNLYAMKMFSYVDGLDILSDQLNAVINKILGMLPSYKFIHIIGHSMGGMLARYYLKGVGRADPRVRLLVTLGSPLRGVLRTFKRFEGIIIKMTQSFIPSKLEMVTDFTPTKGKMKRITDITSDELYNVTMVNITGSLKRFGGGDGLFRSKPIFDMINLQVPANHMAVNKINASYQIIQDLLFNQASIFKIWLLEINFNERDLRNNLDEKDDISSIGSRDQYFLKIVRKDDIPQRYPSSGYIDISKNLHVPKEPMIIYVGMSLHRRREIISIEVFKKGRIKATQLTQHTVVIKLGQKKEFFQEIPLLNQENHPNFILGVSSYRLRHFF